ncbi:MAG: hypothetical protein ACFUZC_14910 [Chthoniobacteraceae bacterium]
MRGFNFIKVLLFAVMAEMLFAVVICAAVWCARIAGKAIRAVFRSRKRPIGPDNTAKCPRCGKIEDGNESGTLCAKCVADENEGFFEAALRWKGKAICGKIETS